MKRDPALPSFARIPARIWLGAAPWPPERQTADRLFTGQSNSSSQCNNTTDKCCAHPMFRNADG